MGLVSAITRDGAGQGPVPPAQGNQVETLRESGIDISVLTFRSAFYRGRAKAAEDSRKGESGGKTKARTAAGKAPKATAETGKPPARWRSRRR